MSHHVIIHCILDTQHQLKASLSCSIQRKLRQKGESFKNTIRAGTAEEGNLWAFKRVAPCWLGSIVTCSMIAQG